MLYKFELKECNLNFFFHCPMVSDNLQSCPDPGHLQARHALEESHSIE